MSTLRKTPNTKDQLETKSTPLPEISVLSTRLAEKEIKDLLEDVSGLRIGSLLRTWAEVSKINYLSSRPMDIITSGETIRRRTIGIPTKDYSIQSFVPTDLRNKTEEELFHEQFPVNITPLMNEDQLWGCYYTFPELYGDAYSPSVRLRNIEDIPELVNGVLTRDMVTACLSHLKRTPILGDYVYIKLDLSSKLLINIDVLQHYKYLVYLDLSANLLTELTVLSLLPYLQYLSVASNRLNTVLEYDTPQWFLTEVHYKFNSVNKIRDLSMFWSITILDLSHNNIKFISGLENLIYLRRLDLSFNHIQRLENLNHLRLLWLDVSYNNISSFEINPANGLWTLLHLEYLNLNDNNLKSMKIFCACTRLRELHARNNHLSILIELAVYMRQMRRLIVLDLRGNPVCTTPGYKDVVINTFPILLSLDAQELDPVVQRSYKMDMTPDNNTFATRRLLRLLYIEQLSRAHLSPNVPVADTTDVPLVVLVGYEGVKKGTLARRLERECSSHIEQAKLHTTASYHFSNRYKQVSRDQFDDMLLAGELLSYSEIDGESYGLSREEAFINEGKVKVVCMDLIGALMLRLRGLRPYLILVTRLDKKKLAKKQKERKTFRDAANENRLSLDRPLETSTLQVLLSERIIITGILNEILLSLPEEKEKNEFVMESDCSLMMDSEQRQAAREYVKGFNLLTILASKNSLEELSKHHKKISQVDPSLKSIYKGSQVTDEFNSFATGLNSLSHKYDDARRSKHKNEKTAGLSVIPDSSKSCKSVTFTSQDNGDQEENINNSVGTFIDPVCSQRDGEKKRRSISTKVPWNTHPNDVGSGDDLDLWLTFLLETGLLQPNAYADNCPKHNTRFDDPAFIMKQLSDYLKVSCETHTTNIRDEYEDIHMKSPGLFWDTVTTDNFNDAFVKLRGIIFNIYNSQSNLKPMFDIDFPNLNYYPTVQKKLDNIWKEIAPQRLFH